MKEAYAPFYLEGRDDRLLKHDIDTEEIARQVLDDKGSIHELLTKAAVEAAAPLRVDRKKRVWIDESSVEIKSAGGDSELAYQCYVDGRVDQLVAALEDDVLEDMAVAIGVEGDDDDEDEEDDETEEDKS